MEKEFDSFNASKIDGYYSELLEDFNENDNTVEKPEFNFFKKLDKNKSAMNKFIFMLLISCYIMIPQFFYNDDGYKYSDDFGSSNIKLKDNYIDKIKDKK